MASSNLQAVILAAGRSRRFKTEQTKLGFLICGQEMLLYPVKLLRQLNIPITLVVGHQKEHLQEVMEKNSINVSYAEQLEQRGTGDAVLCSRTHWNADNILIMHGDVPLLPESCIRDLIEKHISTNATITFATAHNSDPSLTGYGRVIKENGYTTIIEDADFIGDRSNACCVNPGIYLIKRSFLEQYIDLLKPSAATSEIYFSSLVGLASSLGLTVETVHAPFDQVRGVNTLKELWAAEHIKRSELIAYWMAHGVQFSTAQNVHVDIDVIIGPNTFIGSGAVLLKGTHIGTNCHIDAFSFISNTIIADNVTILTHCALYDSVIKSNTQVGPFAYIRNDSFIGSGSMIGSFIEINGAAVNTTYTDNATYFSKPITTLVDNQE